MKSKTMCFNNNNNNNNNYQEVYKYILLKNCIEYKKKM